MVRKRVGLFLIRVAFLFQTVLAGSIQPELPSSSDFDTVRAALKITFPDPDLRLSGPAAPAPGCGPETVMNETLQGNPLKICETSGLAPLRGEPSGNAPRLSFPMELVAGMLVTLGLVALAATMWQALTLTEKQ